MTDLFLHIIMHYYAFVINCLPHLILSVTWLFLLYKFTRFFLFIYFMFLSDEEPTLETLDYAIRIGSTPTFLYFDLFLNTAYAAHYV